MRIPKEHLRLYLVCLVTGFACYVSLFSNALVNQYDGLYVSSHFLAGAGNDWHEVLIGRWFWPFLDRIRYGYAGDPFQSYLSLAILSVGHVLFAEFFSVAGKKRAYAVCVFLQTSTVVCVFLSYRYMSPTFALSYTLALASAYLSTKEGKDRRGMIFFAALSTLCCVLSLGLFQAHLGCTCLMMAAWIVHLCLEKDTGLRQIFTYIARCAVILVCGMIIYKVIWDISLRVTGTQLTSYEGVDTVTVSNIVTSLPRGIIECYRMCGMYFLGNTIKYSASQPGRIHQAMMVLTVLLFVWLIAKLFMRDAKKGLVVLCILPLIAPALSVYNLLAPDYGMMLIHMTAPFMMLFPVILLTVMDAAWCPSVWAGRICVLLLAMGIYGNIYQTACDLTVMQESTKASETLMADMVHTLIDQGIYTREKEITYAFVGRPSDNPMYQKSGLWNGANDYARVGEFWISTEGLAMDTVTDCIRMDYYGLLRNLGIELTICPDPVYDELKLMEEVQAMPLYPAEGSIRRVGEVYVIKVSHAFDEEP